MLMHHDGQEFTEKQFRKAFEKDLLNARYLIIIESAYIGFLGLQKWIPILEDKIRQAVRVCAFLQAPKMWHKRHLPNLEEKHRAEIEYFQERVRQLERIGVHITIRRKTHPKLAIIDDHIFWSGSLNILSHDDTEEEMYRWDSRPRVSRAIRRRRLYCQVCEFRGSGGVTVGNSRSLSERLTLLWKRLGHRRELMGISQQVLAEKLGTHQSRLSEIASGKRDCTLKEFMQSADELEMELMLVDRYRVPALLMQIEKEESLNLESASRKPDYHPGR